MRFCDRDGKRKEIKAENRAKIKSCILKIVMLNSKFMYAGVAQLVEQLICNQRVGGSNPLASLE
jgi:hypothetical protein